MNWKTYFWHRGQNTKLIGRELYCSHMDMARFDTRVGFFWLGTFTLFHERVHCDKLRVFSSARVVTNTTECQTHFWNEFTQTWTWLGLIRVHSFDCFICSACIGSNISCWRDCWSMASCSIDSCRISEDTWCCSSCTCWGLCSRRGIWS